jgi:(2R)-ethylmalonyl-CoA mutase
MSDTSRRKRDQPWLMRTYSGHSSAKASNDLYRTNLGKGQTGLSVAFDLPTQTGYDADHPLASGEVGKVGVPISTLADMDTLFDQIPISQMNTSMTINATAAWLLALYIALAEKRGIDPKVLRGTTQNDIIKEYLSRGTYIFPPNPSMRLTTDVVAYCVRHLPKWNPINICSYHLQEAGATPVQELAYALSTARAVLDGVRQAGQIDASEMSAVVGRMSFFLNAGIRFVEETAKVRAFSRMWDELTRTRYGVDDAALRRFRYGVQVNSLGLTEQQPENNVQRIVLEMLSVVLGKSARARAVQLPAWNEALGLPRPWDQQWSLRIQQVMAFETDLLEYEDILDGSYVIESKIAELIEAAEQEIERVENMGGTLAALESGYIKRNLVESQTQRMRAIETGQTVIVGVNGYTESEDSPLAEGSDSVMKVDPQAEREQIERLKAFRARRNPSEVETARRALADAAKAGDNLMPASIRAAHAGVTTGEWADTLRAIFGEYRPPTGIDITISASGKPDVLKRLRERLAATGKALGRPVKILIGKPGLDGHSNGAEQIAVKARDVGFEVVYEGIRLTPSQIAKAAVEEGVHIVGLSVLSGSHLQAVSDIIAELARLGAPDLPIVVGGIIPFDDAELLLERGIAAVYTPKDHDLNDIMSELIDLVRNTNDLNGTDAA